MSDNIWAKVSSELPPELVTSLRSEGLHKVASRMAGTDLADERAIYETIGASIFYRKKEASVIKQGLLALDLLGGVR